MGGGLGNATGSSGEHHFVSALRNKGNTAQEKGGGLNGAWSPTLRGSNIDSRVKV